MIKKKVVWLCARSERSHNCVSRIIRVSYLLVISDIYLSKRILAFGEILKKERE